MPAAHAQVFKPHRPDQLGEGHYSEVVALAVGLGVSVVATGPVSGIVISFAATTITEWAVEEAIEIVGEAYGIVMCEYENNVPDWRDVICSRLVMEQEFCSER
ncbi:hypothetical protein [Alteromonas sp. S015]|uniref:hypothetical protein n=1 Tax=Alteromonas sp. S015 TaxID=3117401 RepID=UPI002FE3BACE